MFKLRAFAKGTVYDITDYNITDSNIKLSTTTGEELQINDCIQLVVMPEEKAKIMKPGTFKDDDKYVLVPKNKFRDVLNVPRFIESR